MPASAWDQRLQFTWREKLIRSAAGQEYGQEVVLVHASYLLNPAHVREIRRFCVVLSDGTELLVPEKKYTRIKRLLLRENDDTAAPQVHSVGQ